MKGIRHLINDNGRPFISSEIQSMRKALDDLIDDERENYRNQNAQDIAQHGAVKFLIVSGPGTGKSHLFIQKIDNWYQRDQDARVFVTSFVRKLVVDLQSEIKRDKKLNDEQRDNIMVTTLHKFARSIVERNHGTNEWRFSPHFRIIGQFWKEVVWGDVLAFYPDLSRTVYTWKKYEEQLHDNRIENAIEWVGLRKKYFRLCHFYNAAGFADLILRATEVFAENAALNNSNYFIIDEYQDFNLAEEALINKLVYQPKGLLIVGDDEQVLYEKLKSGKPTLIRKLYKDTDYVKGMLPFCGRSSYHITKTAEHFIQQHCETDCIEKVYLPLKTNTNEPKVQIIACSTPQTAIDYIEKFIADQKTELDERKRQLSDGEAKDAFLLILTPGKEVKFYANKKFDGRKKLSEIVSQYQSEARSYSEDYYQLLGYYSLARKPNDNFALRKVLHYRGVAEDKIHQLIAEALQDSKNLCDLDSQEIKDVLGKCTTIKSILESGQSLADKLEQLVGHISVADRERLQNDMHRKSINQEEVMELEHEEEEEAELEEIEVKQMGAVELMTIVGSKGLSADHVIIIGFDNVNMGPVTRNAFYVAMTRARKSLHILTALKSGGATRSHNYLDQLPDRHIELYSYKKSDHIKQPIQGKQEFKKYLNNINLRFKSNK